MEEPSSWFNHKKIKKQNNINTGGNENVRFQRSCFDSRQIKRG